MFSLRKLKNAALRHKTSIIAVTCYVLLATIMTWPFIINPFSTLVSAPFGDIPNSVTKFEAIKNEGLNPFFDGHISSIAVPDGLKSNVGVDRVSFFSTLYLWITTLATSSLFAHAFFVFLAYVLTGAVTYFFVKNSLGSSRIAFLCGFLMTFFPLFVGLARAAPIYMHAWLYILPIWSFLYLFKEFSWRRVAVTVLSVIPAFYWTPYFSFHIMLIGGSLLLAYLLLRHKTLGSTKTIAVLATFSLSWLALLVSYYLIGLSSAYSEIPNRSINEIYEQSLHPLMLLLPPAFSWWGESGHNLLTDLEPRAADTNLYLGISVLALAFFGAYVTLRKKLRPDIKLFGIVGLVISLITFSFALAPTLGVLGISIPTPNYIIASFVPSLRAGQRLVVPLMLGLVMLVGIGLYYLYRKVNLRWHTLLTLGLLAVFAFDLSIAPPELTSPALTPHTAQKLARMKDGLVAQYINGSLTGDPSQIPCKLYLVHRKPIVNYCGMVIDYPAGRLQTIHQLALLSPRDQLEALHRLKVRYVIIQNADREARVIMSTGTDLYSTHSSDGEYTLYTSIK